MKVTREPIKEGRVPFGMCDIHAKWVYSIESVEMGFLGNSRLERDNEATRRCVVVRGDLNKRSGGSCEEPGYE